MRKGEKMPRVKTRLRATTWKVEAGCGGSIDREVGDIAGGNPTDIGADAREDLRAVHSAHQLPAARRAAAPDHQPIEVDAFVAQRVALIDADHDGRQSPDVFGGGEARPGQRVACAERVDAVA